MFDSSTVLQLRRYHMHTSKGGGYEFCDKGAMSWGYSQLLPGERLGATCMVPAGAPRVWTFLGTCESGYPGSCLLSR